MTWCLDLSGCETVRNGGGEGGVEALGVEGLGVRWGGGGGLFSGSALVQNVLSVECV